MEITNQTRDTAYDSASTQQLFLYEDPASGATMWKIAEDHLLLESYSVFANAVGDVILGLVPQEQLPLLLTERLGINQANAMRITADVLDFLEPLNNDQKDISVPEPKEMEHPTETKPVTSMGESDDLAAELAETEAAFKELQPIRTMAHDMETLRDEEPVHQAASQDTILNGQGNAAKNTEAQWGTPEN